jgi:predicted transcriptional regulator
VFVFSTIPSHGGDKMAFWQKKEVDFEEMQALIEQQPGISAAELARLLEVDRSTITRRLPSMDEAGFLLYEDDDGGLHPF